MQDNERTKSVARIRRTATFPEGGRVEVLVISILGLEVGERARNIFPSALMMGENRNDYTWVLDNEAFLVISKGSRSPLESPTRFSGPSEVRLG